MSESRQLRDHAIAIWQAGVAAVDSERLVHECVGIRDRTLDICGHAIDLTTTGRIAVVGAGKAGAGMAAGFEAALGEAVVDEKVSGWVNVPADCVRRLQRIHLHAARPAGLNEPAQEGVDGALQILHLVSQLNADDICVVLLSGGGSALLPAPVPGISLADKQAVTRMLMQSGATIDELNCVRKQLSQIKGGRLAQRARAGMVITLIISDVVGDPLETIASGPTVPDDTTRDDALAILQKYAQCFDDIPPAIVKLLSIPDDERDGVAATADVHNYIIGNNRVALDAAARHAEGLGYHVHSLGSDNRGEARTEGAKLARLCQSIRESSESLEQPVCVLSGGEPVVELVATNKPRKGGRNQELVLAALKTLWGDDMDRIVVLSGGTDGEDGPTDAAGAFADADIRRAAGEQGLQPDEYLAINNSYAFFESCGGLLKTGPTHTNVMDIRVALIDR